MILLCFVFASNKVYATFYFNEDFTNNNDQWLINNNTGFTNFNNGVLNLSSLNYYFPFVISKNNIFPEIDNYSINIRFRYPDLGYMGNGIGIGFTNASGQLFYQFGVWNDKAEGSMFFYNDFNNEMQGYCKDFSQTRDLVDRKHVRLFLGDLWHELTIERKNLSYYVYLDKTENPEPIFVSNDNQCVPQSLWFGNNVMGSSTNWTSLSIDKITIKSTNSSSNKFVIIPGLGASWNSDAMVYNQNVDANSWKMTPFVKNYEGLINNLKNNGLIENQDYFVWNYDWRKPVSEIADKLNIFLNEKVNKSDDLILLGHSLGGVVARIWSQDHKDDGWQTSVYTFGSPHQGTVTAYNAWSGMELSEKPDLMSLALNTLLVLKGGDQNINALRDYAPVLKDLLPTFNFAQKNNKILPVSSLASVNTYLIQKNTGINKSNLELAPYVGINQKTEEKIVLAERNIFDKVANIWPDGKPIKYVYGDGDGTVLTSRATIADYQPVKINSGHGDIVNNSLNDLMNKLNMNFSDNVISDNYSDSLVFFMGSPADYSVKCDENEKVEDHDGWVLIKNNNFQKCAVSIIGTNDGTYHFIIGKTGGKWAYFENQIKNGQIVNIDVNPTDGDIVNDSENAAFLENLINSDLNLLLSKFPNTTKLNQIKLNIQNKKHELAVNYLFDFRKTNNENEISSRLIGNIGKLWKISKINYSVSQAKNGFLTASQRKSLVEKIALLNNRRGITPNTVATKNYFTGNKYLNESSLEIKQNKFTYAYVDSFLANKLFGESQ